MLPRMVVDVVVGGGGGGGGVFGCKCTPRLSADIGGRCASQ